MPFELDIQKSEIILSQIDSCQNRGIFVIELQIKSVINFFQGYTHVLTSLENVGDFTQLSLCVVGVQDLLDLFFGFIFF